MEDVTSVWLRLRHISIGVGIAFSVRLLFSAVPPEPSGLGMASLAAGVEVIAALVLGYPAAIAVGLGAIPWGDPALALAAVPGALGGAAGLLMSLFLFRRFLGARRVEGVRYGMGAVIGFSALHALTTGLATLLFTLAAGTVPGLAAVLVALAANFAGAMALIVGLYIATSVALRLLRAL